MLTERIKNGKTYTYYYPKEDRNLAYWLFYHKYQDNEKVDVCSCGTMAGTDDSRRYFIMVTYK